MSAVDRATVFGEVAETYDRMRPDYPGEMFDDLAREGRLVEGSSVLEVGCGTGIATRDLVDRGYQVTAVDPDSRMLDVARRRFAGGEVRFIEGRFEAGRVRGDFDLVFAAGSWHWLDADTALARAAAVLARSGVLAVCWNLPRPDDSARPSGLDEAYRAHAPELLGVASQTRNRTQEHRRAAIASSRWFQDPLSMSYPWSRSLRAEEYCDLLSTHSDHVMLGPARLSRLLDAVGRVIDDAGGRLELRYETVLYVAHRS